ncbi:MAG: DUF4037 domain-containing protein [Lachnospiraceae bacterium]|nr:DUF4037 domain-containing protein [Lachnospiraceae bacterium]
MKGLELAKGYYEEYGRPMIEEQFSDIKDRLAIGLVGSGSECLGYDDEVSEDHDFEPGFCIFLPGEDIVDRKTAFKLERAYAKLPKEYKGYKRSMMSPVGGERHGVIRTADFYKEKTGLEGNVIELTDWFRIPSFALKEAVSGEVWFDGYGEFTRIRESLKHMPEDVRLKKLAGRLLLMAQSGQYNYTRIVKHGEPAAAQLAVYEYVTNTLEAVFLLNREYMPYYKWSFRALRDLKILSDLEAPLYDLMTKGNEHEHVKDKYFTIEEIAQKVINVLYDQGITKASCGDLEKHAYSVNGMITDGAIRNLNILYAV